MYSTFKNKYVLSTFPDFTNDPAPSMYWKTEHFEGFGVSHKSVFELYHKQFLKFKYSFIDHSGRNDFDTLFDSCYGRSGSLWVPSWNRDIFVTGNIGASDTNINIQDISYSTYYPETPGTGRYLFFYKYGGSWWARKVTATPAANILTIESALGSALATGNIQMVCILYLVRFDIDELEWMFHTPDVAETVVDFIELPHEYASLT